MNDDTEFKDWPPRAPYELLPGVKSPLTTLMGETTAIPETEERFRWFEQSFDQEANRKWFEQHKAEIASERN